MKKVLIAVMACLALVVAVRPVTAGWWPATYYTYGTAPLEFSNGQKVVTGRYNRLHAVYQDNGAIYYINSIDGGTWSTPVVLACGSPGKYPAIAADGAGKLAVVWVDVATNSLQYVYHDGVAWSMPMTIVAAGTEPSIVARGTRVYLAWTSIASVRYATFSTLAPTLVTGEVLESTTCSATHYRFPSITLVDNPCNPPIPLVGFLFDKDEQTSGFPCVDSTTSIGPKVYKRDNVLGVWNLAWSNLRTSSSTGSTVQPISLSVSSRSSAGDVYVGYSDVQNGGGRTEIGHGKGASWSTPSNIDFQAHHIHVRANTSGASPVGTFRLALTYDGGYDANHRDGVWAGAGALSWTSATTYTTGPPAARPHAHWWKRCSAGTLSDFRVMAEEDLSLCIPCPGTAIGVELEQVTPCPTTGITTIPYYSCNKVQLATAFISGTTQGSVTAVDFADAGALRSVSDRGASILTSSGGTIEVTWRRGRVAWSSESSFALTGATEDDLSFTSTNVFFTVQKEGALPPLDRIPPVCQAR